MNINAIEICPIYNDWSECNLPSDAFIHVKAFDITGTQVVSQSMLIMSSKSPGIVHEALSRNCENMRELMQTMHPSANVVKRFGVRKVWPNGDGEIKETLYDV